MRRRWSGSNLFNLMSSFKTFTPKGKSRAERQWFLVDAKGKTLGHLATRIADILRGKNKPLFTPHLDLGDYVVVINAEHIRVTGKKEEQKEYIHHTGYRGHLRRASLKSIREKHPSRILERAVAGMVARNKLKKRILEKLFVYAGESHPHAGQHPQPLI